MEEFSHLIDKYYSYNQELTNLRFFFSYEKSLSTQSYQNPLYIRIITLSQL